MGLYSDPYAFSRMGSMFDKPAPRSGFGNVKFNPTTDTSQSPYQQGSGLKRFFTNVIPEQKFQSPVGQGSVVEDDDSLYDEKVASDFQRKLMEFNKPGPARTAYMDAVRNTPTPQEYAPSGWRRLAATIGGAAGGLNQGAGAGAAIAENINNTPYKAALESYQNRTAGLGEIANLESQDQENAMRAFTSSVNLATSARDKALARAIQRGELTVKQAAEARQGRDVDSQIQRRSDQTGIERGTLQETIDRDIDTRDYQQGQIGIGRTNARTNRINAGTNQENALTNRLNSQSQAIQAGAASQNANTNSKAQELRQTEYDNPAIDAQNEQRMTDLILQEMRAAGNQHIIRNPSETGPELIVDPNYPSIEDEVRNELNRRMRRGGRRDAGPRYGVGQVQSWY